MTPQPQKTRLWLPTIYYICWPISHRLSLIHCSTCPEEGMRDWRIHGGVYMYPEAEKTCIGSWKQNKTTQCANGQNKPTGKERSPLSVFQIRARAHRAPSCTSPLEGKEKQMCNAPWSLTRLHGSTQMADLCIRAEHKGLANTSASFDVSQCISMQLWQLHSICHGVMLSTMEELLFQASSSWSCEMNRNPSGAAFVPVKGLLIFVWAAPHLHLFAPSFPLAPLGERVAIVLVPHALESNRNMLENDTVAL